MSEKKEIVLSASRIQKLDTCFWAYFCNYILKLPDKSNDGAKRGTICHLIFECLLSKHREKYVNKILKNKTIFKTRPIEKLLVKHAKKLDINSEEHLALMDSMILVGLKNDFYCQGSLSIKQEGRFDLAGDGYKITGFIDKRAEYDGRIVITDYKSSKSKYEGEELDANLQALIYKLAEYKTSNNIPDVNFLFLRFPDDAIAKSPQVSESQLLGFEEYLKNITNFLGKFDEQLAKTKYAYDDKSKKWLCGFGKTAGEKKKDGSDKWACPYKFAFDYWEQKDDTGKIVKTSKDENELQKLEGHTIEKKNYGGCPRFSYSNNRGAEWK